MNDPNTYAQGTNRLLVPLTPDDIDKSTEGMAKSRLAVIMCFPAGAQNGGPMVSTPIGSLHLYTHPISHHYRFCTLGITLAAQYQGKGYGAEAINWTLDWAFRVAGMHAVRLVVFSFNERAVRLSERLGFIRQCESRGVLL
jgi:RimJ/RimL family protein N-acetyltransferase